MDVQGESCYSESSSSISDCISCSHFQEHEPGSEVFWCCQNMFQHFPDAISHNGKHVVTSAFSSAMITKNPTACHPSQSWVPSIARMSYSVTPDAAGHLLFDEWVTRSSWGAHEPPRWNCLFWTHRLCDVHSIADEVTAQFQHENMPALQWKELLFRHARLIVVSLGYPLPPLRAVKSDSKSKSLKIRIVDQEPTRHKTSWYVWCSNSRTKVIRPYE